MILLAAYPLWTTFVFSTRYLYLLTQYITRSRLFHIRQTEGEETQLQTALKKTPLATKNLIKVHREAFKFYHKKYHSFKFSKHLR